MPVTTSKRISNVILCGKSFIACWALQYLLDLQKVSDPIEISVLPNRDDSGLDTWQPSFAKSAQQLGIRVIGNLSEGRTTPDGIILSLECDRLIRVHEVGTWRAYNIHFSALPSYRGCLTSVWPLRNGEVKTGVTLHVISPRIDAGPIIDQIQFKITPFMTSRDIYQLYQSYGFELFKKNIRMLLSGRRIRAHRQIKKRASYYSRSSIDFRNRNITDFHLPTRSVVNYVRSLIFKPYQLPVFHKKEIISCDELAVGKQFFSDSVGRIVFEDMDHAIIVCLDGYVRFFFERGGERKKK